MDNKDVKNANYIPDKRRFAAKKYFFSSMFSSGSSF